MHSKLRAAGYVRVSTEEQTRGFSLDEQERAIRERVMRDGVEIDEATLFIDAGISGTRADRPQYQAMLAAASCGAFSRLYVWKFDRLGRDAEELLRARRMLEAAGVALVSLTEGDAESTLVYGVRALVAQEEREKIAERTRMGVNAGARNGKLHGRAPFGYRRQGDDVLIVPAQAVLVQRVFNEYLAGSSPAKIADELERDEIPSPRGTRWDRSQITNMLGNPAYIGRVRMNGALFAGKHEPIVDLDAWEAAERLRTAKATLHGGGGARRPSSGRHLLVNGLLRCTCGSAMRARTYRQRDLEVYLCRARDGYRGGEKCTMRPIERSLIDGTLLEYFEQFGFDVDATRAQLTATAQQRLEETTQQLTAAEFEVAQADDRIARVRRAFQDGKIDADDWNDQRDELSSEREAAARQLERLSRREIEFTRALAAFDSDVELIRQLGELRSRVAGELSGTTNIEALRAAFAAVFDSVELVQSDDGELDLVPHVRPDRAWQPTAEQARAIRAAAAKGEPPPDGCFPIEQSTIALEPVDYEEISSALSQGTNALLRIGATPATCVADVLEALGVDPAAAAATTELEPRLAAVHAAVVDAAATADDLVRRTGLDAAHVAAALAELELLGLVAQADGRYRGVMS